MIPFVIEMRGQAQVSSKQTAQTQKRLDELSKRRPEVHPAVNDLCTSCVQEGGFEGPENGPKQRRINNRLLSYRPVRKTFCYLSMPPAISSNLRLTALTAQIPHSALARPPAPL